MTRYIYFDGKSKDEIVIELLICDDDKDMLNELRTYIDEYMSAHEINCNIKQTDSASEIMKDVEYFDIAVLDIQIGNINGVDIGAKLKEINPNISLFFITNYSDYQDNAMDLQPFRFLTKPFDKKRLFTGLDRAMEFINESYANVFVANGNAIRKICINDIIYVKRENRKVIMVTVNEKFTVRESLNEWEERLKEKYFYKLHNSFIVNIHWIREYMYSEVTMENNEKISIAPRRRTEFRHFWFEYMRRK